MIEPLTDEQRQQWDTQTFDKLPDLLQRGWQNNADKFLTLKVQFASFDDAISAINRAAKQAKIQDYHPDIHLTNYSTVVFSITNHDNPGLTSKDYDLARAIENVI